MFFCYRCFIILKVKSGESPQEKEAAMNRKIKEIAVEAAQKKVGFFETLLQTSSEGILIGDTLHNIILANDRLCRLFDCSNRELTHSGIDTLLQRFDNNGLRNWQKLEKKVKQDGAAHDFEFTLKTKERVKYVNVNASRVKSAAAGDEDIIIYVSTWLDISESKVAEEKLRESDIRFHTIVDQSPFSMIVYKPNGRPLLVNQAAAELWGYSPDDLEYLFANYNIFKDEQLIAKGIMPYIEKAFAGEFMEIPPVKYDQRTADTPTGSGRGLTWIRSYLYPAKDAEGNVSLVVMMHEDVTTRKQVEDLTRQQLELAQALSTTEDINDVLSMCVHAAIEVSGMDSGGIYLVDETTGDLNLVCHQGLADEFIEAASVFKAESPNTRLVIKGKPVYREYANLLPDAKDPAREKEGLRFIAIVPVLHEGRVIACLNIASHVLDKIPVTGRNALETLALQIGGIISRLQVEEALRESEERYRTLQMNIPVGIFRTTPDGKIISANPAMVRMFGFDSEEEFLAFPAGDFYVRSRERKRLMKTLQDKEVVSGFEVQLKHKDGSLFWGAFNIKGVADKEGNIISHDGILENISERKKWSEAIIRAREEWERTFDSVPELITILDKKYTILRANKAAADRLGIPKDKLIGMPCYKVFHDTNQPPQFCPHARMLQDGQEHTVEIHEENLDCDLLITASPLYDGRGKLIGAVHAARDITEQKKVDKELQKTEKLESLGLLARGIAHDFNNILTSILVNISLSRIYIKNDDKPLARLNEAEKAISRAKDLTRQLLTFSSGGAPIRSQASIDYLLRDTAEFTLSGSNVKCEFDIPDNLRDVEIDKGQISQVIQNLVMNAVQAMPGGGTIRIGAENISLNEDHGLPLKDGKHIKIRVEDQGVGIPREFLNKVFDPFFSTKQKGSGLGLSTSYSIIKNHNGLLTLESELGSGTTFYVYLPVSGKRVKKKKPEEELLAAGQGKVLLMDDEEIILDATSDILQEIGYTVAVAKDGSEAIRMYREARQSSEPFDVVIMDLVVPGGMGGMETMQELQKIDPGVKAVVSSGYSTDPIIANYEEYGFWGAVSKPYKIEHMNAVLHRAIGSKTKRKRKQ